MTCKYSSLKAPAVLKTRSDKSLIEIWEMVSQMEFSQTVADVRGWIMDEIEFRHPEQFAEWLDGNCEDMELRRYILH